MINKLWGSLNRVPKEKVKISYRMQHWFTYHPWLKLIGLLLAIMAWLYVRGEIGKFNY